MLQHNYERVKTKQKQAERLENTRTDAEMHAGSDRGYMVEEKFSLGGVSPLACEQWSVSDASLVSWEQLCAYNGR